MATKRKTKTKKSKKSNKTNKTKKKVKAVKRITAKPKSAKKTTVSSIKSNDTLVIGLLITVIGLGLLIFMYPTGISFDHPDVGMVFSVVLICIGFILAMNSVKD